MIEFPRPESRPNQAEVRRCFSYVSEFIEIIERRDSCGATPGATEAISSRWMRRPAGESVLEEMGNPVVRADAGRFPHRMAARIACAIRSAVFRGEGGPSPAALRAASAREGLSPQPVRGERWRWLLSDDGWQRHPEVAEPWLATSRVRWRTANRLHPARSPLGRGRDRLGWGSARAPSDGWKSPPDQGEGWMRVSSPSRAVSCSHAARSRNASGPSETSTGERE